MNQSGRVTNTTGNQKIVFLAQRSQNSGNTVVHNQQNTQSSNTVVKFVSNSNTQNTQKVVSTQQKLVVVCMSNSNTTTTSSQGGISSLPQMGLVNQNNPSPASLVSKNFMQQQKHKSEQITSIVDDLSHLT